MELELQTESLRGIAEVQFFLDEIRKVRAIAQVHWPARFLPHLRLMGKEDYSLHKAKIWATLASSKLWEEEWRDSLEFRPRLTISYARTVETYRDLRVHMSARHSCTLLIFSPGARVH